MAIDPIAEQLRKDTLAICKNIFKIAAPIYSEWPEGGKKGNVFDMGSFPGSPDGRYPDNFGKWMNKWITSNKDTNQRNPAWCKFFITKVVMPEVCKINKNGSSRKNAGGGLAAISGSDKSQKTYKFPVPGMVWFKHKNPKVGKKATGNNEGSGHVGIVTKVDYKSGKIWTCEGNAGSKIVKDKPKSPNYLNNFDCYYYPIWTETEESLREAADKEAGFKGAADAFINKVDSSKPNSDSIGAGTSAGSYSSYPSTSSSGGTSSSEKQQFQTPYMTVAEATDYLNKLYNPQLKEQENVDTKGTLNKDAIPVA